MKNKVTVTIAEREYTFLADQDTDAVQKIAAYVDAKMREVLDDSRMSLTDGAILAAMNIAEDYFKERQAAENLRRQVKESVEESAGLKQELSEAKREIFKLQNKK